MADIPVEPLASAPQAAPQPTPPASQPPAQGDQTPPSSEAVLPPALIKIPAIQAVTAGVPPAFSMSLKSAQDRSEVKLLADNKTVLTEAGFGFYRSLDGKLGVMFNSLHIHPQDLQAADKAGKLLALAPDFDIVNHTVAKMGLNHPMNSLTSVPQAPAQPTPQAPPQAASGVLPLAPPASVQNKLASARLNNIQPGAPTSGPSPGAGRLLNSVLKGVV